MGLDAGCRVCYSIGSVDLWGSGAKVGQARRRQAGRSGVSRCHAPGIYSRPVALP